MIEALNQWARFVYAPLLDDRSRKIQEKDSGIYGRDVAEKVHGEVRRLGGVRPPREFVFMDRAAIGLGSVFLPSQGRDQLVPPVPRADRRFRCRRAGKAASGGAGGERAGPAIGATRAQKAVARTGRRRHYGAPMASLRNARPTELSMRHLAMLAGLMMLASCSSQMDGLPQWLTGLPDEGPSFGGQP